MLEVCSLASGSSGNSFFFRTGDSAFLVDVGISFRQLALRLNQISFPLTRISAVFITHEHGDHVRGLPVLLKHHPVPVYLTRPTRNRLPFSLPPLLLNPIQCEDELVLQDTTVTVRPKQHDAVDPCFYTFAYRDWRTSFITDVGTVCPHVIEAVNGSDILFLESNHDELMLKQGRYHGFLKKRISGNAGHLSNIQAARLVRDFADSRLKYLFLSHLSENNNTPDQAMSTFQRVLNEREDLDHLNINLATARETSKMARLNWRIPAAESIKEMTDDY